MAQFLYALTSSYNFNNKLICYVDALYKFTFHHHHHHLILTDFHNYFTVRIRRKFVILSLKIPPYFKCVATLPYESQVS